MEIEPTPLHGVLILKPRIYEDDRGFFLESWHAVRFAEAGIDEQFVQDNHSRSQRGILRGLHLQTERPQGKLVWVTSGAVFDVVVDCRANSPTCGKWFGRHLTGNKCEQVWVPPGCAHGFYVVSEYADFLYKCTDYYHPISEISLKWDDPNVGVAWPLPTGEMPILSEKDKKGVPWSEIPLFDAEMESQK